MKEQDLSKIIAESIQKVLSENIEDEGLFGGLKGAGKGAVDAVKGGLNKFKRGVMDNGLSNEYNGQTFKDRAQAFGKNVKAGFKNGDKSQELNRAIDAINAIKDQSILGPKGVQYADALINCINMSLKSGNGNYQKGLNSRYGSKPVQQTDQNQQNKQVAESK